jgi:ribosome maturation factor RimP
MKQMKGTEAFPSSFTMTTETPITTIEKLLSPLLADDIFLVTIKVKPINNYKIYLDADSGLGIEKCIKINRALYKIMEEMALHPDGDFSLEVSSPGIEEPLKLLRQYKKNIGRNLEVITHSAETKEGVLKEVTDEAITLEYKEGKGKKAILVTTTISFTDIKEATVQIKF